LLLLILSAAARSESEISCKTFYAKPSDNPTASPITIVDTIIITVKDMQKHLAL